MSKITRGLSSIAARATRFVQPDRSHLSLIRLPVLGLTVYVWWIAISHWVSLFHEAYGNSTLGYDLHFSWQAANVFSQGGSPYANRGFVYPPSHVLLASPLADTSFTSVKHVGLYLTVIVLCGTVMVSAEVVGRRFWGLAAAIGVLWLRITQPVGDEIILENVSALMGLMFAFTLLLSARQRWYSAAVILGLSVCIKPMLLPMYVIFILVRKWRALGVAVGVPVVLNVIAICVIHGIGQVWSILPFLVNRSGVIWDSYNAAIVSVGRLVYLNVGTVTILRFMAVALAIAGAWWSWKKTEDFAMRIILTSGTLMIGVYLAGALTQDHYMFTLVPLLVAVFGVRSPLRWPTAWIGAAWIMAYRDISPGALGVNGLEAQAVCRCIGLGLLLATICFAPFLSPYVIRLFDRAKRSLANMTFMPRPLSAALQRSVSD